MSQEKKYKIEFIVVMCCFGVLGPVVKAIGLPSSATAFFRAIIAAAALAVYFVASKRKIDKQTVRKSLIPLCVCGIFLAGDWIGLFTAYNYTSVATSTICYYTEPVFFILGCALFLKEKISKRHYLCIFVAFVGVALVSGIVENGLPKLEDLTGVLFSIGGALCYTGIILINKKWLSDVDPVFRTEVQLLVAAIITLPYVLLTEDVSSFVFTPKSILLLIFLGVAMTACTYIIYFGAIVKIPTKTAAIFSYCDPVVAVIVSVVFMHEPISIYGIIGSILVIGAAIVSEIK